MVMVWHDAFKKYKVRLLLQSNCFTAPRWLLSAWTLVNCLKIQDLFGGLSNLRVELDISLRRHSIWRWFDASETHSTAWIIHRISFYECYSNTILACYTFKDDNSSNFCIKHPNTKLVTLSKSNASPPNTHLVSPKVRLCQVGVGLISKH